MIKFSFETDGMDLYDGLFSFYDKMVSTIQLLPRPEMALCLFTFVNFNKNFIDDIEYIDLSILKC